MVVEKGLSGKWWWKDSMTKRTHGINKESKIMKGMKYFKYLAKLISLLSATLLCNKLHSQKILKSELIGLWVSIEKIDTVEIEIKDSSHLIFRQKEGSRPGYEMKCDFKFDTLNHEQVLEMSVPGTHRTMYLFLRRKSYDEFKVQMYEPINPVKAREGWKEENDRNTQILRRVTQ